MIATVETTELAMETPSWEDELKRAAAKIAGWMEYLIEPEQVVELRALRVQDGRSKTGSTWAGTYTGQELIEFATSALELSENCGGVYYTLNPLNPDRLNTRSPRTTFVQRGETAQDKDVLRREWVLIDVDAERAEGFEEESASDAEKAHAFRIVKRVRDYLRAEGFSDPVFGDSGNGYHLLYKFDPPLPTRLPLADDDYVRRFLHALADRFDEPGRAKIDRKVYNPSRVCKIPGTVACKGTPTDERPHRRAKIIELPD